MDIKDIERIEKRAIKHYGASNQLAVFAGEIGELMKEISVSLNSPETTEEMADCLIMLEQFCMITGVSAGDGEGISPSPADFNKAFSSMLVEIGRAAQGRVVNQGVVVDFNSFILFFSDAEKVAIVKEEKLLRLEKRMDGE